MKNKIKYIVVATAVSATFLVCGCATVDGVENDAKRTPIGSVVSGETSDTGTYLQRVREKNRAEDRDTWRPQSNERF